MNVNAVTEQLILAGTLFGSALVTGGVWLGRRLRRKRAAMRYGREVTQRLPKYQEPGHGALLVVAGGYDEYQRYCAAQRLNRFYDAALVQYSDQVYAHPGSRYVLIGSYRELPNLEAIRSALTYTGCKPL